MKTLLTTIAALCLFALNSNAQWMPSGNDIYNTNTGYVGINTLPGKQLDVNGDARIRGDQATLYFYRTTSPTDIAYIKHDNTAGTFTVAANTRTFNINNGASFATNLTVLAGGNVGIGTTSPKARLHLNITGTSTDALQIGWDGTIDKGRWSINPFILGVANDGLAITDLTGGGSNVRMVISNAGNVGIGTTNPDQKLTVNGQVHSTSVVVTSTVPADYVFNKDYYLRPLADVKAFVDKNHLLPEVPAAADFKKDGQNLGEMNMLLLKKVEELTLYMVEKDRQVQQQNVALQAQQSEITQLKKQVDRLLKAKK